MAHKGKSMSAIKLPVPKIEYKFRVVFKSTMGILNETSLALSTNLLSVSKYEEPVNCLGLLGHDVTFTFQDDTEDKVYDGIQTIIKAGDLEIELHYLDGNEKVLRAIKFEELNIANVQYGALDYANKDSVKIKLTVSYNGLTRIKQ
jgi:hypothetical protein